MWNRRCLQRCLRSKTPKITSSRVPFLSISSSNSFSTSAAKEIGVAGKPKPSLVRRAAQIVALGLTAGVALSAVKDLAVFYGCSGKAIEKASQNKTVLEALGEPIARGPWYDASLAVDHRRHSLSCTFPVIGPKSKGVLQVKAVGDEDGSWLSFLGQRDWEILIMDAIINGPSDGESNQTLRVNITGNSTVPPAECKDCKPQEPPALEK